VCELDGDCEPTNDDSRIMDPTKEALNGGFLLSQNGGVGNRVTPPEIRERPCS
jgi:hypothetical protein